MPEHAGVETKITIDFIFGFRVAKRQLKQTKVITENRILDKTLNIGGLCHLPVGLSIMFHLHGLPHSLHT